MDVIKDIQKRLENKESVQFISEQTWVPIQWINQVFLWTTKII